VACISGKTKIKGFIERVSAMNDEREKIDLLLARNADEQLKKVDWDKLNSAISSRLDKAKQSKSSAIVLPAIFKIAAGIAVAATVVLITLMIKSERPADIQLSDGRTAMVELIDSKGSASVAILEANDRAHVKVDITGQDKRAANCYVQIMDSSRDLKEKEDDIRPSWFIICRSEYVNGNHGINSDAVDVLYLF
jgi:hypothetical protein